MRCIVWICSCWIFFHYTASGYIIRQSSYSVQETGSNCSLTETKCEAGSGLGGTYCCGASERYLCCPDSSGCCPPLTTCCGSHCCILGDDCTSNGCHIRVSSDTTTRDTTTGGGSFRRVYFIPIGLILSLLLCCARICTSDNDQVIHQGQVHGGGPGHNSAETNA